MERIPRRILTLDEARRLDRDDRQRLSALGLLPIAGGALSGYPWPYDINNVIGGRTRVLFTPVVGGAAIPDSIDEIFEVNGGGYAAKANWVDFGATKEAQSYSRGFETSGWGIQQVAGNIVEEVTSTTRTVTVSIAEIKPEHLQIIENAPSIATVAAVAGASAQKKIAFGSFSSLTRYRIAFVSQRPTASGLVTQTDAVTRGRFVAGVLYEAQIAADDVTLEQNKGELTAASVTFTAFPASGEPAGQEHGCFFTEDAGVIA